MISQSPVSFVDPARGNLHLIEAATQAIDKAVAREDVAEDIDRQPRAVPDIGADEVIIPSAGSDHQEPLSR